MGDRADRAIAVPALSHAGWRAVCLRTLRHTLVLVLASALVCTWILETYSGGIGRVGLVVAIFAPLVLGTPMIFLMGMRQTQLREAYGRLQRAARRDSMTGCLHHGAFVEDVTHALSLRKGGSLLLVDADFFKAVNDRFGHAVGDTALRLISAAITGNAGTGALVGRMGGEEFAVFLPGADIVRARGVAHAIRAAVEAITLECEGVACRLTVSQGGAVAVEEIGFDALFRQADAHLYKVKESGRNNVSIAEPGRPLPPRDAAARPAIPDHAARRRA